MARYRQPLLFYKRLKLTMGLTVFLTLFHKTRGQTPHFKSVDTFLGLMSSVVYNFDNRVRPLINQTNQVNVFVTFNIINLLDIKEQQQRIRLNAWINFTWDDELRNWDPNDYDGFDVIMLQPLDVWRPRVLVRNSLGKRDMFGSEFSTMALFHDGHTIWYPSTVFTLSCDFNLTYFPFDIQHCHLELSGVEYNDSVHYRFSEEGFNAGDYTVNDQWELLDTQKLTMDTVSYGDEVFSHLVVTMSFQRRPLFYVVTFIIPVMFMSYLCFFGFCVPVGIGERSSFAITVQLSLALYITIVTAVIPATSATFPILVYYIYSLLFISGFSVIVIVLQQMHEYNAINLADSGSKAKADPFAASKESREASVVDSVKGQVGGRPRSASNSQSKITRGPISTPTDKGDPEKAENDASNAGVTTVRFDGEEDPSIISKGEENSVMAKAGESHPGESNVDMEDDNTYQSLSLTKDKRNRLHRRSIQKAACCLLRFITNADILFFLIFTFLWCVTNFYFITEMLVNYKKKDES